MRTLSLIDARIGREPQSRRREGFRFKETTQNRKAGIVFEFPLRTSREEWSGAPSPPPGSGGFFRDLSARAISGLELIGSRLRYPGTQVAIREDDQPGSIMLLVKGIVRLSINSQEGRRLILGTAMPGEILGLASAVSNNPYEMTAETQYPCMIQSIPRPAFFAFLALYPAACQNVTRQLCADYKRMHQQLRTLGLSSSAPAKLGRLLLEWCTEGKQTVRGTRIQCSLTHGEIGECIGITRETVSRSLNDFKNRGLVELHGSTLIIPSCSALAIYVGIGMMPDPHDSAA